MVSLFAESVFCSFNLITENNYIELYLYVGIFYKGKALVGALTWGGLDDRRRIVPSEKGLLGQAQGTKKGREASLVS